MLITIFADDRKKFAHNETISIWLITVVNNYTPYNMKYNTPNTNHAFEEQALRK
jgi:hypothetical protein